MMFITLKLIVVLILLSIQMRSKIHIVFLVKKVNIVKMLCMSLAERTMNMSGWLDPSVDGLPDVGPLTPMKPEIEQSGKLWRCYELQITCGEWAIASHGKLLIPLVFFVHIDESAITFLNYFSKNDNNFILLFKFYY